MSSNLHKYTPHCKTQQKVATLQLKDISVKQDFSKCISSSQSWTTEAQNMPLWKKTRFAVSSEQRFANTTAQRLNRAQQLLAVLVTELISFSAFGGAVGKRDAGSQGQGDIRPTLQIHWPAEQVALGTNWLIVAYGHSWSAPFLPLFRKFIINCCR